MVPFTEFVATQLYVPASSLATLRIKSSVVPVPGVTTYFTSLISASPLSSPLTLCHEEIAVGTPVYVQVNVLSFPSSIHFPPVPVPVRLVTVAGSVSVKTLYIYHIRH